MTSIEAKTPLLSVRSASKIYRMGEVDVPALRELSLDIYNGEFLIVVGPSGSGKTTLLNLIGGMDRPTSGEALYLGRDGQDNGGFDLGKASDRQLTMYRRRRVGFIFQFFNLLPSLTALENIEVAIEIVPDPLDPMETLRMVDLAERADHFPAQLSGGQQQRVAIARALASNPPMLLCDEPTGALDSESAKQVLQLLSDLCREQGRTVVLITHNNAISRIGDRVVQIRDGAIAELTENPEPTPAAEIKW